MALLYLQIDPPSLYSHLYFSFSKPPSPTKFSLSLSSKPKLKPCNLLNRVTQNLQFFKPSSTFHTTQASSSTTATPTEAKGLKESVAEIYDRRRLIAQNIPWDCTAEDIKALFEKHGTVLDVEDLDGRIIKVAYARASKKNALPEPELSTKKYNVYVGNLAWRVRSQDLRDLFNEYGKIIYAEIVYQSKPRRPAGYGFVSFASKAEAVAAISTLNGKAFMGRTLRLGISKLQPEGTVVMSNEVEEASKASKDVDTNAELSN